MAAVIVLGAGATGVAYLLYYYVMNSLGAVRAAGVTLLVPVTAVFWGVVLLNESLSWTIVIGMAVILAGTILTNLRRRVNRGPSPTPASAPACPFFSRNKRRRFAGRQGGSTATCAGPRTCRPTSR